MSNSGFQFNISLSVLNHLGRNLYRSFTTVLGEAVSNAWDADAKNVWIEINRENDQFCIKDDGIGMNSDDFQDKFLKIGYSKRKLGQRLSPGGRPYIGRKGIGKLALLSCADKISVISKVTGSGYVGGTIDNAGLDEAIKDDVEKYELGTHDRALFDKYTKDHTHGTIILFEGIKDGIHNTDDFLKKVIALYFRFSLLDPDFNIFLDGDLVTVEALRELAENTQFIWNINESSDPYITDLCDKVKEVIPVSMSDGLVGFIASVKKPKNRNIHSAGERVGVDLFVNGRLREAGVLKHIPSARVPESYLYGQIHFNSLDGDNVDRFTSSREGILADDPTYKKFLTELRGVVLKIIDQWDSLREKYDDEGDPDNLRMTLKERRAGDLAKATFKDFVPGEESANKNKIEKWCKDLLEDARFNFESYANCFVSENLVRRYIDEKPISLSPEAVTKIAEYRQKECDSKNKGNISIDIRNEDKDISYLSMDQLANMVDKRDPIKEACLARDANEYKPIRDALAHTALLSVAAKNRLGSVYENIKARVKALLSENS